MATIAAESDLEMNPGTAMEGKISGTQTGTMTVDVKTGMPVASNLSQNMKGSIKVQGMEVQMELTAKTKTTVKEVK
jgi:hypothetical protein